MGLGIPPLETKILPESNPLKCRILVRRLAVHPPLSTARSRPHLRTNTNCSGRELIVALALGMHAYLGSFCAQGMMCSAAFEKIAIRRQACHGSHLDQALTNWLCFNSVIIYANPDNDEWRSPFSNDKQIYPHLRPTVDVFVGFIPWVGIALAERKGTDLPQFAIMNYSKPGRTSHRPFHFASGAANQLIFPQTTNLSCPRPALILPRTAST